MDLGKDEMIIDGLKNGRSVTVLVSCSLDTDKARAALQVSAANKQQVFKPLSSQVLEGP